MRKCLNYKQVQSTQLLLMLLITPAASPLPSLSKKDIIKSLKFLRIISYEYPCNLDIQALFFGMRLLYLPFHLSSKSSMTCKIGLTYALLQVVCIVLVQLSSGKVFKVYDIRAEV